MTTMTKLYILLQLDSIKGVLTEMSSVFLLISGIWICGYVMARVVTYSEDKDPPSVKHVYRSSIMFSIGMLLGMANMFIPTTERAAMMIVGAEVIDSNTTSILTNLPEKYAKILEAKADKYMKETLEESK